MKLILLSGWPGAGKTEFGQWLKAERGFVHVETDAQPSWVRVLSAQDLGAAISARDQLRQLGPNVVVEWGFVVSKLASVQRLRSAGFDCWWFDGDHKAAREGFIRRRERLSPDLAGYERQTREITGAWTQISAFYGDRVVRTVLADGSRVSCPELARRILTAPASTARAS